MKKLLALLGGTALAAAVIPYAYKKNEETDEKTIQALLWKATINADPEEGQQKVALSVGFNNPFQSAEADLYADDLTVNYHTAPVCGCECGCDDECPCDGECDEGSVWEMALFASHFKLNKLVVIVDHNKMQSLDFCENTLSLAPFAEKWYTVGSKQK